MIKYSTPKMELLSVETEDVILVSAHECDFSSGKCPICGKDKGGFGDDEF